jgi:DNA-binding CsgD family transcriptional regulator
MTGHIERERTMVAQLTEKQRACMQLVVMRKSSKEIARELGIAKPTVDQRIVSARQILGARDRNEAALIFLRGSEIYDRITYDPACVGVNDEKADSYVLGARQDLGLRLEEPAMAFGDFSEQYPQIRPRFQWSQPSEIDTTKRLAIIVGMTFGILAMIRSIDEK